MSEKKSKYEEQVEKMKKLRKVVWKRMALYMSVIYVGGVLLSGFFGLPRLYAARVMLMGVVLILISFVFGAFVQNRLDKKLIPPPEDREVPELNERVKKG